MCCSVCVESVLLGGSIDNEDAEAMVSTTACCCVHEKGGNHRGVYKMLNDRGSSINDNHNGQGGRHGCGGRLTMAAAVVV